MQMSNSSTAEKEQSGIDTDRQTNRVSATAKMAHQAISKERVPMPSALRDLLLRQKVNRLS